MPLIKDLEMESSQDQDRPKPNDLCPCKKRRGTERRPTDIQGEDHMKTEAEIGMMLPQA